MSEQEIEHIAPTLRGCVVSQRIRKGKPHGISGGGAYWSVFDEPITLRTYGGDGIGQSAPQTEHALEIRHYRDGDVRAFVRVEEWHQNSGTKVHRFAADAVLDATTAEEVAVILHGMYLDDYEAGIELHAMSGAYCKSLFQALVQLGMEMRFPGPDEVEQPKD